MQKSITFKNANISFSDEGKGTAVVLIHGFLENSTMWKDIIPEIAKRNRVITIDLLGHGKTDCIGYSHSMELFAETLEAVLKHLKIRKSILIGHSLGGYVALAFAEKNPQKIKGLCLMNSTSNEDDDGRKNLRLRANKMIQQNFTNMVRMSFLNLFGEESRTKFKEEMKVALSEALQTPIQGYIAAQEGMRIRLNRNHVLAKNDFKKLIIIGKKDPVLNYELSLAEAEKTNTEVVVFNDGHMSHIENKTELIDALKRFVKYC
ncbi:alpha/beta hydrolase [Polaribacter aestuariivivens]|uniref:Alpha/beta hydrolase n=1 Tax=Polaribacter aestuariivivens TaxID=2304626 RepID=A0A5S3N4P5_9FLAO|nr:alpha/beta hydrolase [Polaribacter aestuariivivens]TMM29812.1 alpha/beta hydrolase [Polaribacter aestuariivivens]